MDDFGYLRFCSYIFVAGGAKEYNHQNAEQSKVLNTPGAEKQTKRELFDALWQELE